MVNALSRSSTRQRIAVYVGVAILSGIAASVFARIYSGNLLLILAAGAAILPVVLSAMLRRTSLPFSIVVSFLGLAGYLVLAVWLSVSGAEKAAPFGALLLDAVQNSGARIMTSTIPILPSPDTVIVPLVLVWLAGLVAAEIAGRTRIATAAFGVPLVVYIAGLVLIGPNVAPTAITAVIYVAVAALFFRLASAPDSTPRLQYVPQTARKRFRRRQIFLTVGGIVTLIALTIGIGSIANSVSNVRPADPRTYVEPPIKKIEGANPLERLAYWARNPDPILFTVETTRPSRINWVTLADYDGITWTPIGEYRSAGTVLPVEDVPATYAEIHQTYEIDGLEGLWLPAVDRAMEVGEVRASYDAPGGTLLLPEGLGEGLTYTVRSRHPEFSLDQLVVANVRRAPERYTELEQYPSQLGPVAIEVAKPARSPYEQALLLERYLRENYHFDREAPSGHSYAHLGFFLNTPLEEGGHRGTSEQFATTFATMARTLGLPSRVVVGFHAGTQLDTTTYAVTAGDAFAWPEIYFDRFGWVALNPTPTPSDVPPPLEEKTAQAQENEKEKARKLEELDTPGSKGDGAMRKDSGDDTEGFPLGKLAAWSLAGVATGAAGVFLVGIPLARWIRRWRRRRGADAAKIVGAWAEIHDVMRLAGHAPPGSASASRVAEIAVNVPKPEHAADLPSPIKGLATDVNAVHFAPYRASVTPDKGQSAATTAQLYAKAVAKSRPLWRRFLWYVDPRPLWW